MLGVAFGRHRHRLARYGVQTPVLLAKENRLGALQSPNEVALIQDKDME
jgi:hypothetical protein